MDSDSIAKIKTKIENELTAISQSDANPSSDPHIQKDDTFDEMDLCISERDTKMELQMRERKLARTLALNSALRRIKEGTYGMCVQCDDPIEVDRVFAVPTAIRCARCQEEGEIRRRRYSPDVASALDEAA